MMRKLFLAGAVLAVMVYSSFMGVSAQELEEVAKVKNDVVVSVGSFGEFRKAVQATADKIHADAGLAVAGALGNNSPYVAGMATAGPIGLVMDADPTSPFMVKNFLGFVPVKDGAAFSAAIAGYGLPVTVNVEGTNAFLSLMMTAPVKAPADPSSLLGGLDKRYQLAIQIAPKKLADLLVMFAGNMAPEQAEAMENVKDVLAQLESVLIGFNVDKKNGDVLVDIVEKAVAGSDQEKSLAKMAEAKSKLVGFYDEKAMAGFQGMLVLSQEQIDAVKAGLEDDESMPEDMKKIVLDTLDTGKLDFAGSVNVDKSEQFAGFIAFSVADGAAVEKMLRRLAKEEGAPIEFLTDDIMEGVRAHKIHAPQGEIALALTKTYVFAAFGQGDQMKLLKEKVTTTLKAAPPKTYLQAHFDISLVNYAPELAGDDFEYGGKVSVKAYAGKGSATGKITISQQFMASVFQIAMQAQEEIQRVNDAREMEWSSGGFSGGGWDDEE